MTALLATGGLFVAFGLLAAVCDRTADRIPARTVPPRQAHIRTIRRPFGWEKDL